VREEGVLRLSPENTHITFVGSAGRVSHEGSFSRLAGRLVLPADDPKDARLEVEVDMDSATTRIFLLTTHLKSRDFFDVARYPGAKFVSRRIEPSIAPHATHLITGDLTIHGETRSLSFPARIVVTPYVVTVDATIPISQSEFGMERAARKTDDVVPVSVSSRIPRR
jgi:polyisoprenoid-binding protein YceI